MHFFVIPFSSQKLDQKYRCEMNEECIGYTFEQSSLNCMLHSSTDKGLENTRGTQTGVKKSDYTLTLPDLNKIPMNNL